MKTFKQSRKEDNLKIMVIAPLKNSENKLNHYTWLINDQIRKIKENNINIPCDSFNLFALITTSFVIPKQDEEILKEAMRYLGL